MTEPCCSGCGLPRDRPGQRYCRACHAEVQRKHRAKIKAELARLREGKRPITLDFETLKTCFT